MGREIRKDASRADIGGSQSDIVHLTAAAAAKAAATALLTNQVIKRVRMNVPGGGVAHFKVQKCVIESGSALCSIIGTPEALPETETPEVWVRVMWEHSLSPVVDSALEPVPALDPRVELHWLTLSPVNTDESTALQAVPLLLHFIASTHEEEKALSLIPRELVASAITEAINSISPDRLERGVRVMIGLAHESSFKLPNLQTKLEQSYQYNDGVNLSDLDNTTALTHLALSLDSVGSGILPMLNNSNEVFIDLSQHNLSLQAALNHAFSFELLDSITICGNFNSIQQIALGGQAEQNNTEFDTSLVTQLATRFNLPIGTVQSLREAFSLSNLMKLINHDGLGWIFDKICEGACAELRKSVSQKIRLTVIIFGSSGAILGRTTFEPGILQL
ncbi:MAG: hypothetical protein HXX08_19480 [Chloroflexi bacterium]|uniref:Uncharacterized protein n=1 Tax=Candidatus Chlorohelix allophototropha TaxID=3003348 RepID=A0A8T7M7W4_9CHLR|nr:hypothetical protein [Chloroflexota bacterium]WJW67983.1 hypothetical protein OZ401_003578 [Chloroflexota bacterium L227-S17]